MDEIGPGVEVQSSELRHLSGTTCIIGGFMAPQFSIAMIPHSLLFCCLLFMCKDGKNLQFWKRLLFFITKKLCEFDAAGFTSKHISRLNDCL